MRQNTYCTLFDSGYLDKGIAALESLASVSDHYMAYVLAMDDACEQILRDLDIRNVQVVSMEEFLTPELRKVREERNRAEFSWTCSASMILYVLEHFKTENCAYFDADLYFYSDPAAAVEEMYTAGKSVQVVEHGFPKGFMGNIQEQLSGRFCVEFNTFCNTEDSLAVLRHWRDQILEKCNFLPDGSSFGDQMYLTDWPKTYHCVHVCGNPGAGIAPWNICRFQYSGTADEKELFCTDKKSGGRFKTVFYHFHDIKYMDPKHADIGIHIRGGNPDQRLIDAFYRPYLKRLYELQMMLANRYDLRLEKGGQGDPIAQAGGIGHAFLHLFKKEKPSIAMYYLINKARIVLHHKKDLMETEA